MTKNVSDFSKYAERYLQNTAIKYSERLNELNEILNSRELVDEEIRERENIINYLKWEAKLDVKKIDSLQNLYEAIKNKKLK